MHKDEWGILPRMSFQIISWPPPKEKEKGNLKKNPENFSSTEKSKSIWLERQDDKGKCHVSLVSLTKIDGMRYARFCHHVWEVLKVVW